MVDSKEIEELRALAFASIPAVARKATGKSTLKGKRKRTSVDTEEGEILSDEDAAAAMASTTSIDKLGSQLQLDCTSNTSLRDVILEASSKPRGIEPISLEVSPPVSTITPSLIAVVPSHIHRIGSEENCDLASQTVSMAVSSIDENGSSATLRMDTVAKNEETKSYQRNSKVMNASQPSRSATGSLPSRIPIAPLPTGGIRKEADAFLASLNIPATASPSHLPGFAGDRSNSLVIKFSDDDSDTDGEQDGQLAKDTINNKKWIGNELPMSSSLGGHRLGLSSQSTSGLKSEIDRVKKQIAAIERAKGMVGVLPVSRLSKSIAMEVPRQLNLKPGALSTSLTSRMVPVDLESLRQQIAAKESELKRRKQRGSKESFSNGSVPASSWLMDALDSTQASDARLLSPEKSESEPGGMEVFVEEVPVIPGLQVNEASNNVNDSSVKMEGALNFEASIQCDNVLAMTTSRGPSSIAPAVQGSTFDSDAQLLDSLKVPNIEFVPSKNTKPMLENCDFTHTVEKKAEVSRNKAITTPKRKRHESDRRSDTVKKQKRKGFSPVSGESLMLSRSKEPEELNRAALLAPSLDGSIAARTDVSDDKGQASQSLESKGNLISVKGMPEAVLTTPKRQQDTGLQTGSASLVLNSSDGMDVAVPTCVKNAFTNTVTEPFADNNDVSGVAMLLQKNSMEVSPSGNKKSVKVAELTSQQDNTVQAAGMRTDVALSRLSSPSRAIVERQGESSLWAYNNHLQNPNMAILQGVSNQRLEYENDALWKLQEEEDAIDKELEEAQQNRRRCEVREHFARRQYRDAQEALHSANLRCEMLFQRREILSASVKAAQVRLHSNKSSIMSQHGDVTLVSVGSPRYSGRDPFRLGTSIWAKEKGETGNWSQVNRVSDQDCDGFGPDFAAVINQSKELSRSQLDGCLSSETTKPGANVGGLDEPVGFNSSASKSMVGQPDIPRFVDEHATVGKAIESINAASCITLSKGDNALSSFSEEPSSQHLSLEEPSARSVVKEDGLSSGDSFLNSVFQSRIGEGKYLTADENRLPITTVAEAVHGSSVEKESHHGFSSASFATDLERDGNQDRIFNEKSSTLLMEQEAIVKQGNFSFEPFSLHTAQTSLNKEHASNKITDESLSVPLRVSSKVENDIGVRDIEDLSSPSSCEQDTDGEPQHGACLAESLLVENAVVSSQQQQPHDGRRMDTTKQTLTYISTADACFDRQIRDSRSSDNSFNKIWSKGGTRITGEVPEGTGSDGEKVNRDSPVLQLGRSVVMQELKNFVVPMVDLGINGEDDKRSVGNPEAELEVLPILNNVPGTFDGDHRLEEDSARAVCFVPSASLNLLFRNALHPHSSDIWKQQTFPEESDQSIQSVSGSYESPLGAFRSYVGTMQGMDVLSTSSYRQLQNIDPHKVLCKYEHRGKCNNDECIWQHKRDYMLCSSQTLKPLHQIAEVSEIQEVPEETEKKGFNSTHLKPTSWERADKRTVGFTALQNPKKWNVQVTKVPVYRIGSYLRKAQCFESPFSCMVLKRQLGLGLPSLALHRQVSMDMPCLLDSSLKLPTLTDGSVISTHLRMEDRLRIEDEGQHAGSLGDVQSLLEATLELFDYDLKIQKSEVRKSVLYVLSRGLEANPCCVAMWLVYLHLFYRWEKSFGKDDLFINAVQHNKGSYELWMMFINSRRHLMGRLKAYEAAINALGSEVELQGHPLESKSSILLDLALQKLNFMCMSDLSQEAASWINELTLLASEDVEGFEKHETSSSFILLSSLARPDLCILWICCAYVILQRQLPINVMECLGCKQQLFFQNIWLDTKNRLSCGGQVMRLMRIAASQGKGCMKLDVNEVEDNCQLTKEFFVVNFVQCAAVCEGLDYSFTIAEKYFELLSPSVELTLLRAQLEEHHKGKAASLDIFEEALSRWPLHRTGKVRLWNQYFGCALEVKGAGFVKVLLARCASEICDSDSCRSVSKNLDSVSATMFNTTGASKGTLQQDPQMRVEVSNAFIQRAFQLLPSIVKRQLVMGPGVSGQLFSYQDVVFGFVNLAFLEALNRDVNAARNALHSGLNMATDADSLQHCLKEIAVFNSGGFDNSTALSLSVGSHKMLELLDRCIVESQLLGAMHPLSKVFCESIKKRRVREFVNSLLAPWPTGSSFLNSILETIHGPTLLPKETLAWRELLDFTEKMLEIQPSNVRLAVSICRAVQSRVPNFDSSTGSATLFWCTSLLLDSLCQASPEAPEPSWVEAGGFLKMIEVDSLLEDFYLLALSVHPFSTSLWHGLLTVSSKTGNLKSALESAKERGVKLD